MKTKLATLILGLNCVVYLFSYSLVETKDSLTTDNIEALAIDKEEDFGLCAHTEPQTCDWGDFTQTGIFV